MNNLDRIELLWREATCVSDLIEVQRLIQELDKPHDLIKELEALIVCELNVVNRTRDG